jgi:cobalt-zinc-cadmium efflux system outer membrane protein
MARALERSPELKTYSYDVRAAEALVLQAGLKPNPELEVSIENPTGSGEFKNGDNMEQTIQLSKLLELGGKRPARIAEARAERALVEWEYEAKRVEVLKDTTLAFVAVLAAQRGQELAKENLSLLERSVTVTQQRVEAAKVAAVESIRASVAVRSASIELDHAEHDLNIARGKLASMWGARMVDFDVARGDLELLPSDPDIGLLRSKLARNPELARWQTVHEGREAALRSASSLAVPDLTLFAGPRVTGVWEDITGVIGISIPLPFSNRNQGNIAAAQAKLDKTQYEKLAAEAGAFAELNAAYQELLRAGHEAVTLKTKLLPEAEQAVDQLNASYEVGRSTQLEVLDARRTLITSRQQYLQSLTEYHKALAEIDALTAAPTRVPQISATPRLKTSNSSK